MEGELTTTKPEGKIEVFIPFNIHSYVPSEHNINGKQYDVKMHIVHINKATGALKGCQIAFLGTLTVKFTTNLDKITKVDEDIRKASIEPSNPTPSKDFSSPLKSKIA